MNGFCLMVDTINYLPISGAVWSEPELQQLTPTHRQEILLSRRPSTLTPEGESTTQETPAPTTADYSTVISRQQIRFATKQVSMYAHDIGSTFRRIEWRVLDSWYMSCIWKRMTRSFSLVVHTLERNACYRDAMDRQERDSVYFAPLSFKKMEETERGGRALCDTQRFNLFPPSITFRPPPSFPLLVSPPTSTFFFPIWRPMPLSVSLS